MPVKHTSHSDERETGDRADRRVRFDARRNLDLLLQTAKEVFADSGVDAPVREIAERAGVGIGTVYRHFPRRTDLIAAVFFREIDACADTAQLMSSDLEPFDMLVSWMERYTAFVATKRGLAKVLHSGDPAFDSLPVYFDRRLRPALQALLDAAAAAGQTRGGVAANDLLVAVASLCMSSHAAGNGIAERMVALLLDGLRCGASGCDHAFIPSNLALGHAARRILEAGKTDK